MECPGTWFMHIETQFAPKNITIDNRKYKHLVISLPQDFIMLVLDVIQKPPLIVIFC